MTETTKLTADIVTAYVASHQLAPAEIPALITKVHEALAALSGQPTTAAQPPTLAPAVPVKKSVTPEYIICLEDGRKLKMLKRYLRTTYNMTPDDYRAKWGLPADYPMVAPNYAQMRADMARTIGLGKAGRGRPRKTGR